MHCTSQLLQSDKGYNLSEVSSNNNIMGIQEGLGYDNRSQLSTFLGKVVDFCCGIDRTDEVSRTRRQYVEVVQFTFHR